MNDASMNDTEYPPGTLYVAVFNHLGVNLKFHSNSLRGLSAKTGLCRRTIRRALNEPHLKHYHKFEISRLGPMLLSHREPSIKTSTLQDQDLQEEGSFCSTGDSRVEIVRRE